MIGGLFGYAIGYFLLETLGRWVIDLYGYAEKWQAFEDAYAEWGVWIILIKGLTPIPYKIVTIASGATHFSLVVFIVASVITRGVRFFWWPACCGPMANRSATSSRSDSLSLASCFSSR